MKLGATKRNAAHGSGNNLLFDDLSFQQQPPSRQPAANLLNPAQNSPYDGPGFGMNPSSAPPQPPFTRPSHQPPGGSAAGAGGAGPQIFDPSQIINNPVMSQLAADYGANLAATGQNVLNERVERFLSTTHLKLYFAVDTNYVLRKLGILLFPFKHTEWQMQFDSSEPVAPRYDVNAPDLYIPAMAYITYILLAGVCLGTRNEFTPEHLGVVGSSALVWYLLELLFIYVLTFVLAISGSLRSFVDVVAYCGYKYFGVLCVLLASLVAGSPGFYAAWVYSSACTAYFLVKTLRLSILSVAPNSHVHPAGHKRKLYFLLLLSASQPLLIYWLTYHVAAS